MRKRATVTAGEVQPLRCKPVEKLEPPATSRGRATASSWRRCKLLAFVLLLPVLLGSFIYVRNRLHDPQFETEFLLGAVTDRTARVWVYAAHHSHVLVHYRPASLGGEVWQASAVQRVESAKERHWTLVVDLNELTPNTAYHYRVLFFKSDPSSAASTSEVHRFRTYPPVGEGARFSFVYGSCIEMGFPWPFDSLEILSTWKRLYDPLFALILGDIVYADLPFPMPFERAYRKLLTDAHYARFFKDASRYAIYDDHELANNWDRGADLPLYRDAMEAYDAFIGSANPELPQERPLHEVPFAERKRYYSFTVGNVGLFVLDERPYRSGNYEQDGPNKTMLGAQQKECLKRWLVETNDTLAFRFIASPGMFASVGGPADGWAFFEHEREELFDFMEDRSMRGVVLLSGDVHWAGAFEHRKGLYEFATSPIHTFPLFPNVLAPNGDNKTRPEARTLFTHTWTFHYSVVEIDTEAERPFVRHTTYAYLLDSNNPYPIHDIKLFIDDVQLSPPPA